MQMAASAFDILIESVSDNIGLRWVWTNQRCNRTACIHRMQFKGLGVPQQVFCNAKMVYIYVWRHILLALWGCSKRLPNLTIILQEWSSVFKLNLKQTVVFLLGKVPSLHSVANRTSYPALSFYQGFHHFFLQAAESSLFSKIHVDTAQFLW